MIFLILILPLFGFLSAILFGRSLGQGATYVTTFNTFLSFIFSSFLGYKVIFLGASYNVPLYDWLNCNLINVQWGFLVDSLTVVMLIVVTFISTLVHLYSLEYMSADPHLPRFMSYLSLFTFCMLILVTANNFMQMFVGWEGVGLSSYLLINFWSTRIQANKAAIKAMLINRIGDLAILLAMFLIFCIFGSLNYDIVFGLVPYVNRYTFDIFTYSFDNIDLICLLLFIGAMGKSAQFGLHSWLPDAMEGPTPVSALIHAATMVTAGVFLVVRSSYLFEYSEFALSFIVIIGATTAFFASTIGLFQNDLKKIIAYSTCSQLGYMIFACGLSGYEYALFHLSNHAFFKALLFLSAGAIIHAVGDEQDIRKMGGLQKKLPFTYAVMLIGSLALMGFPFLSGFYSKDGILELAYARQDALGDFAFILGVLAAFSTSFYSIRLLVLVFLVNPNGSRENLLNAHEPGLPMSLPLGILCVLSICIGYFTKDLFIGLGTSFWNGVIFILPENYIDSDIEFIPVWVKYIPLIASLSGASFAYLLYAKDSFKRQYFYLKLNSQLTRDVYTFFNRKWFFDRLYNQIVGQTTFDLGYNLAYKNIDRGILEQFGPFGVVNFVRSLSYRIKDSEKKTLFNRFSTLFFSSILIIVFFAFYQYFYFSLGIAFVIILLSFFYSFYTRNKE